MESSRGAADLDGGEGRSSRLRENEVASEESDGADEMVAEATYGEDLNGDGGGLAGEEVRWDFKEEFIVPGRVFSAETVGSGSDLVGRVDPYEGVGLHAAQVRGWGFEILRRDQVDLQGFVLLCRNSFFFPH